MKRLRTRFAPSPTGLLHVGNAYSALHCQEWADRHGAELILRIEDIDHTRCRDEYVSALLEDLAWLGLTWPEPVLRQSRNLPAYRTTLERLHMLGVIYPCFCTRQSIAAEIERMGLAPHAGEHGELYPGTCRSLAPHERQTRMRDGLFAWRLDMAHAMSVAESMNGEPLLWRDGDGRHHPVQLAHDTVVGRKDIGISYHLAVVVDDASQGVTHVIRGEDLRDSTPLHRLLQALLDLPSPVYIHHPLLLDIRGERLAKRNNSTTLASLREAGVSPSRLRRFLLEESQGVWPFADEAATFAGLAGD
ncbi:MAG TPA: tRNA glutamyl-Q(34) synthetase GluQRS [Mariprofundaceae bacterium]|nr:tRNA glutamyl-Q(34) synthetase GluQRS [Mariprofundaceae bacterium]